MSDLEELEHKIQNLPVEELSKFRAWFIEFGAIPGRAIPGTVYLIRLFRGQYI